jgi:hypothetical protein
VTSAVAREKKDFLLRAEQETGKRYHRDLWHAGAGH